MTQLSVSIILSIGTKPGIDQMGETDSCVFAFGSALMSLDWTRTSHAEELGQSNSIRPDIIQCAEFYSVTN